MNIRYFNNYLYLIGLLLCSFCIFNIKCDEFHINEESFEPKGETPSNADNDPVIDTDNGIWWFWDSWYWFSIKWVSILLVVGLIVLGILMYRGYQKVKPNVLKGIPTIPMSNAIYGHLNEMQHPSRHFFRLRAAERKPYPPLHQLSFCKNTSVFINDAKEVAYTLQDFLTKGEVYKFFRFNPDTPDLFASDGAEHSLRSSKLTPIFTTMMLNKDMISKLMNELETVLNIKANKDEALDIKVLLSKVAFDAICHAAFKYDLKATSGSDEGQALYNALEVLLAAQSKKGVFPIEGLRDVTKEDIFGAQSAWRSFLEKMVLHMGLASDAVGATSATTGGEKSELALVLKQMMKEHGDLYGVKEVMGELHVLLNHGQQSLASALIWMVYALQMNPSYRLELEETLSFDIDSIDNNADDVEKKSSESLINQAILETLRIFPPSANMTIRTVQPGDDKKNEVCGTCQVPEGTPLHIHIYTLQNTAREWDNASSWDPTRWNTNQERVHESANQQPQNQIQRPRHPKCPFGFDSSSSSSSSSAEIAQCPAPLTSSSPLEEWCSGIGFQNESLSFLPFSAGHRACPAKKIVLQLMAVVLRTISSNYRLDCMVPPQNAKLLDPGCQIGMVLIPAMKQSMSMRVTKGTGKGANAAIAMAAEAREKVKANTGEGWD